MQKTHMAGNGPNRGTLTKCVASIKSCPITDQKNHITPEDGPKDIAVKVNNMQRDVGLSEKEISDPSRRRSVDNFVHMTVGKKGAEEFAEEITRLEGQQRSATSSVKQSSEERAERHAGGSPVVVK